MAHLQKMLTSNIKIIFDFWKNWIQQFFNLPLPPKLPKNYAFFKPPGGGFNIDQFQILKAKNNHNGMYFIFNQMGQPLLFPITAFHCSQNTKIQKNLQKFEVSPKKTLFGVFGP